MFSTAKDEATANESRSEDVPTVKQSLEILSVEVVQSAPETPQNVHQITGNDEAIMDTEEQPAKVNHGEVNENESENVSSAGHADKKIVLEKVPEMNCYPQITSDTLITDSEKNNSDQNCTDSQSNTVAGEPQDENLSNIDMIQEDVTNSNMQQTSEAVSETVKDISSSNSPIRNEIEEVVEMSTPAGTLSSNEIQDKSVVITSLDETAQTNTTTNSTTGLSLLAQYGSDNEANDSDNDSVIEVPTNNQDYRSKIVEIDSDSDTDSSSSGSDVEYLNKIRKTIEKRMEVDDEEDDDGAENGSSQAGQRRKPTAKVKAKGELQLDDLPPIHDLQITVPEDECIVLGKIHSIVDQLVLVSALPNSMLVDLETVLFLDKGQRVLGEVFDVLGQVADPLYCVRFNSNQQINDRNIQIGDVVYLAPKTPYTQYIILSSIMKQKGSDASWENDLEPPPRFLDYSDDEEQQLARRQLRNKDRPVDHDDAQKRQRRDSEEPQVSGHSRPYNNQQQPRQRYPPSTRGSGPPNRGSRGRSHQQYNPQYRTPQIPQNHNPSSWHSNYYPQPYAAMPPPNVQYPGGYARMPPAQAFPQQVPVYPPMGIPYPPPPQLPQHIRPPNPQHSAEHHQYMHQAFNMRPPTIPGHFDPSTPPPGSQ